MDIYDIVPLGITVKCIAKNTVISRNFLVRKLCFPQNFHTRKLGEITVFSAVLTKQKKQPLSLKPLIYEQIFIHVYLTGFKNVKELDLAEILSIRESWYVRDFN